jgi:transcription-repair coupling factor (superfamily II helicase)
LVIFTRNHTIQAPCQLLSTSELTLELYIRERAVHKKIMLIHKSERMAQQRMKSWIATPLFTTSHLSLSDFWGGYQNNHDRIRALANTRQPGLCHATLASLLQKTSQPPCARVLESGKDYDPDRIVQDLVAMGFILVDEVMSPGSFALRGGILDIFSPADLRPKRLDFFAEKLVSIHPFHPETQLRTGQKASHIELIPPFEFAIADEKAFAQKLYDFCVEHQCDEEIRDSLVRSTLEKSFYYVHELFYTSFMDVKTSFLDFMPEGTELVFFDPPEECIKSYQDLLKEWQIAYELDLERQIPTIPPQERHASERDFSSFTRIEWQSPHSTLPQCKVLAESTAKWRMGDLDTRFSLLGQKQGGIICAHSQDSLERMRSLLENRGIIPQVVHEKELSAFESLTGVALCLANIVDDYIGENHFIISDRFFEFSAKPLAPQSQTRVSDTFKQSLKDLKIGDFVVHLEHGVGRYIGLKSLQIAQQAEQDFLVIEYADQDKVYVPVDKISLIQKYGESGKADKLKSPAWEKRKSKARAAIRDIAQDLLKIEAQRAIQTGIAFSPPNEDYAEFEASFKFKETPDQARAIADVMSDMSRNKPMDRLVCGDVGFGKTEVAIRAIYRCVLDGYQAVLLAPTTILSLQHYQGLAKRFKPFGVNVAQINRFVHDKEVKRAIKAFASGEIDVLIGTHRLFSKDVVPKKLGLIVIDEEQRFGVEHKEALKKMRASCDILTLTATPIPRTLHMSMIGLRDISIVGTPPENRLPVKTLVHPFDETIVKKAIDFELARGGQVFYLHNRVEDLPGIQNLLMKIVPDAKIGVAHGQLPEDKLEKVIVDFLDHKFSVLLCTTIIESGIDMPRVNTLIVNRSDMFGLSQLYQIRGRVGRSSYQAYAYFLTPKSMTDEAKERLSVLSIHQELGSGFQIASHDLDMRGAGNLLGSEQSGHVSDVGIELYTQMLAEEIQTIKGTDLVQQSADPEIKLAVKARIPKEYMHEERLRIHYYKRFFSAAVFDDVESIQSEMKDRFGLPPDEVQILIELAFMKVILKFLRVEFIGIHKLGFIYLRLNGNENLKKVQNPNEYQWSKNQVILNVNEKDDLSLLKKINKLLYPLMKDVSLS